MLKVCDQVSSCDVSLCSSLVCWHGCRTEIICWCTSNLVTPERIHLLTWLCFRLLCPNCMFIGQSELVIMAEPSAPNIWSSVPFFPKSKVATLPGAFPAAQAGSPGALPAAALAPGALSWPELADAVPAFSGDWGEQNWVYICSTFPLSLTVICIQIIIYSHC